MKGSCARDGRDPRRGFSLKCLDTDFLVAILRGKTDAERKMLELDSDGRQSTTSVSAFELFYGAYKSSQSAVNVEKTKALLERLEIIPVDGVSAEAAGQLLAELSARGHPIDFRDALIAGTAKSNGIAVITRNKGHFSQIKDLKVEVW